MRRRKITRILWILIIVVGNIGCDQVSKDMVRDKIEYNANIQIIDDFITLTKVENTGAFLSLGSEMPRIGYQIIMIFFPLIILILVLYFLLKSSSQSKLSSVAISLLVGGGFGNLIDRILYGSVTDFLHFDFGLFQTGIVNMADISITIGFILMVLEIYLKKRAVKITT